MTQNYNVGRDKYDMWQSTIGVNVGDIYLAVGGKFYKKLYTKESD